MNSFQNLAVGCALCSPPGGQSNSKNAVVDAGLSVGLWAAFWGEIAGLIPAWPKAQPLGLLSCTVSCSHVANGYH